MIYSVGPGDGPFCIPKDSVTGFQLSSQRSEIKYFSLVKYVSLVIAADSPDPTCSALGNRRHPVNDYAMTWMAFAARKLVTRAFASDHCMY
jgi:hypothetical protein